MVEFIPKSPEKSPYWQNILFYLSLIVFLAVLAGYFVLGNFVDKALNNLSELEEALIGQKTAEELILEKRVLGYQKKINAFSELTNGYIFNSNFFNFLESASHPQVQFSRLDLDSVKKTATLSGTIKNFTDLDHQVSIFKSFSEVKNFNLTGISISKEGMVNFIIDFSVSPQLFKQ